MTQARKWMVGLAAVAVVSTAAAQGARPACDDPSSAKTETIAELRDVQGNVLVSDAAGMSSGVDKQRLKNMVRVTTTARAGVTVAFDCGCDVKLKENERLDVEASRACSSLLAAVQAVPVGAPIGAVVPAAGGISTSTGALIATTVGVGAYLLYRNNRNVSPN
jgi:hypothetical protein